MRERTTWDHDKIKADLDARVVKQMEQARRAGVKVPDQSVIDQADQILERLDALADRIQTDHEEWGMSFVVARTIVNEIDCAADEFETKTFGKASFQSRCLEVVRNNPSTASPGECTVHTSRAFDDLPKGTVEAWATHVAEQAESNHDKEALLKKANFCVKIARRMLGKDAPEEVVEDQAVSLMSMRDLDLIATFERLDTPATPKPN